MKNYLLKSLLALAKVDLEGWNLFPSSELDTVSIFSP